MEYWNLLVGLRGDDAADRDGRRNSDPRAIRGEEPGRYRRDLNRGANGAAGAVEDFQGRRSGFGAVRNHEVDLVR